MDKVHRELGVYLTQRGQPDLYSDVPIRLVSKEEAQSQGWSWYWNGVRVCRYGHAAARRTSNEMICSDCDRVKAGKEPIYPPPLHGLPSTYYKEPRRKVIPGTRNARRRHLSGMPEPTRPEPAHCECCGTVASRKSLALDHCHISELFRGWLCSDCNTGLGFFGDSIEGLMNAVRYLERVAKQQET